MGNFTLTPNIGLQIPNYNQPNWQVPTQYDWTLIDLIFGGKIQVPALNVGNLNFVNLVLTAAAIINGLGYTPLNPANNLADVQNTTQALTNLGGIGVSSFMGPWSSSTTYLAGNIVTYNGSSYLCILGPQSGNEPDESPTYWSLWSSSSPVQGFEEIPAGSGTAFTFSYPPIGMLTVFKNGLALNPNAPNSDYSVTGTALTLAVPLVSTDVIFATYLRTSGSASPTGVNTYQQAAAGTVDGSNPTFTLTYTPNPPQSLMVFVNGVFQTQGTSYTISGLTITFQSGHIPVSGQVTAFYFY